MEKNKKAGSIVAKTFFFFSGQTPYGKQTVFILKLGALKTNLRIYFGLDGNVDF